MSVFYSGRAKADMITTDVYDRYLELKAQLNEIEHQVENLNFPSVEEYITFVTIAKNPSGITSKQIQDTTCLSQGTIKGIVLRLRDKNLIETALDESDSANRSLRRHVYRPTQAGLDLMDKLR